MSPSESTNPQPDQQAESEPTGSAGDAWGVGLRRAGAHFMKAGYEILAGINALLEEIVSKEDGNGDEDTGPQRIEVE